MKNMLDLSKVDLKKEIKELQRNDPGKVRGISVKFLVKYVKRKEDENGFKRVKKELKKYDYELPDIDKIGNMEWIPSSLPTIFFLASAKVFNWQEKDILETGKEIISFSFAVKLYAKYFVSVKKTFEKGARSWRKHYTFGQLRLVECDPARKRVVLRMENYKRHPLFCIHFKGIFSKFVEMATGSKNVRVEETKCIFKGDPYHEYIIEWE